MKLAVLDGIPFHFALTPAYPVRIELISKPVHWKPSTVAANTYKTHPDQHSENQVLGYLCQLQSDINQTHIVCSPYIKKTHTQGILSNARPIILAIIDIIGEKYIFIHI